MANSTPQEDLLSIGSFFGFAESYTVPVYQREYAWGRDQIQDLITDLNEFIEDEDPYYLLGQVIAAPNDGDEQWSLIDGQQRTTTLFLLLLAIRKSLTKFAAPDMPPVLQVNVQQINSMTWYNNGGNIRPRLHVAPGGDGFINLLMNGHPLPSKTANNTQKNIKSAYEQLEEYVLSHVTEDGDYSQLITLFNRISNDVYLVRLRVPDQAQALDVFAKLNNRGLRLNSADLLKNLLFQRVNETDYVSISESWEKALTELYKCKGRVGSMDFLMKSMLSARVGESFSNKRVFKGWETLIQSGQVEAQSFGMSLPHRARELANLGQGMTAQGTPTEFFVGTRHFGQIQHLPVLLAGAHLTAQSAQNELSRLVEDRSVISLLAKELPQAFERKIAPWAKKIRELPNDASGADVRDASAEALEGIDALLKAVRFQMLDWRYDNDTERNRIRYVLARTTRRAQRIAAAEYKHLSEYLNACKNPEDDNDEGYHLEHIHPQALIEGADVEHPTWTEGVVHNIGNLTLLNPRLNRLAGANDPENKVQYFNASGLKLTQWLVSVPEVGANVDLEADTQIQMIHNVAGDVVSDWTPEAVRRRARLYWKLLCLEFCDTFGIPEPDVEE
jgi:hypothetical protein